LLVQDSLVLIRGTVSGRDRDEDSPPIFLDSAVLLETLRQSGSLAVELDLGTNLPAESLTAATAVFRSSPGSSPLYVTVQEGSNGGSRQVRLRSRSINVAPTDALLAQLRELFGAERIRLVRS
jgi:DNA polymerase-3 subunit alpha